MSLEIKIFCWFLLSDKALTWDVLIRRGFEGPGRCYLCKLDAESNFHLGVDCPFTKSVWLDIEDKLNFRNIWYVDSVIDCLKNWCLNMEVKHIRSLPIIVLWFIWKARNQSCFEDQSLMPSQVCSFSLGMLRSFPQDDYVMKIIPIFAETIDKTYPWGYFDRSAADASTSCGAGGILYISDNLSFSFKAGLGAGTNNTAELCALKLLLTLAREKDIAKNHIYGDS